VVVEKTLCHQNVFFDNHYTGSSYVATGDLSTDTAMEQIIRKMKINKFKDLRWLGGGSDR
jgi:hypothetical protein